MPANSPKIFCQPDAFCRADRVVRPCGKPRERIIGASPLHLPQNDRRGDCRVQRLTARGHGVMIFCSAAANSSGQIPCPSLPITTAALHKSACRRSTASADMAVASSGICVSRQAAMAYCLVMLTGWVRNTAPMEARTVLGLYVSAQPSSSTTGTSSASAVRRIVPRLPGS